MRVLLAMQPIPLAALRDNYIWVIPDGQHLTVVDPGDAQPVLDYCKENKTTPTTILITHHHHDHTGGISILKQQFPNAHLIGPESLTHHTPDIPIQKHTSLIHSTLPERTWSIVHTPGHTLDHVCYRYENHLFCGDTLFSAGCGRAFEGSYEDLHLSLQKIASLPDDIILYPAHEYTLNNCRFALSLEPNNRDLQSTFSQAKQCVTSNRPTLPTTLAQEKRINPFLRVHHTALQENLATITHSTFANTLEVFATLRKLKDNY